MGMEGDIKTYDIWFKNEVGFGWPLFFFLFAKLTVSIMELRLKIEGDDVGMVIVGFALIIVGAVIMLIGSKK
mgnify:CR=1 FL=1